MAIERLAVLPLLHCDEAVLVLHRAAESVAQAALLATRVVLHPAKLGDELIAIRRIAFDAADDEQHLEPPCPLTAILWPAGAAAQARNARSDATISSGASSGMKCPDGTGPPWTSSAQRRQMSSGPPPIASSSAPQCTRTGQPIVLPASRSS